MNLCKLFGHKHVEKKGKRIIKHSKCIRCGKQKSLNSYTLAQELTNIQKVQQILLQDTEDQLVCSYQKELYHDKATIEETLDKIIKDQCPQDFNLPDSCKENINCAQCWNREVKANAIR